MGWPPRPRGRTHTPPGVGRPLLSAGWCSDRRERQPGESVSNSASAAAAAEVIALREALEQRFPNAKPLVFRTAGAVPTGLGALDAMLPGGGLPRGRLSLWQPGGGATAVLRAAALSVAQTTERSAWIDAQHQVTADGWVRGPMLLRPSNEVNALSCAEELLASGGFTLVVLSGVTRALEREAVRLSRAAKNGGTVLVAVAPKSPVAHLRLSSQIRPDGYQWKLDPFGEPTQVEAVRVHIEANAMGWNGRTDLILPITTHSQRTAVDPLLRDRRGARVRRGSRIADRGSRMK